MPTDCLLQEVFLGQDLENGRLGTYKIVLNKITTLEYFDRFITCDPFRPYRSRTNSPVLAQTSSSRISANILSFSSPARAISSRSVRWTPRSPSRNQPSSAPLKILRLQLCAQLIKFERDWTRHTFPHKPPPNLRCLYLVVFRA